jgi:hypothetical protein
MSTAFYTRIDGLHTKMSVSQTQIEAKPLITFGTWSLLWEEHLHLFSINKEGTLSPLVSSTLDYSYRHLFNDLPLEFQGEKNK